MSWRGHKGPYGPAGCPDGVLWIDVKREEPDVSIRLPFVFAVQHDLPWGVLDVRWEEEDEE